MKLIFFFLFACTHSGLQAQIAELNTAKDCQYMTAAEREMIYEINKLRSDPSSYLQYILPLLESAKKTVKIYGKGPKNYSLRFSSTHGTDKNNIDTTWHYQYEEEVKALESLVKDLKKIKSLSVLKPDPGIYAAAIQHAKDQEEHEWKLAHTGTDGSAPWDRIKRNSEQMDFGNENIAGQSGQPTSRDIVIQLLVDSGIPGYGHRYNMLDPQWTHVACKGEKFTDGMNWWLQEFGKAKK